jgi:phosphotriesterase-related protein
VTPFFAPTRRQLLQMLGASAGAVAVPATRAAAPFATAQITTRAWRPVIRTVLGDVDPASLSAVTLMHEHLGAGRIEPDSSDTAVTNPTQDANWMAAELTAAKRAGVGCVVAAETVLPGADNFAYLKALSQRTGLRIVAAGAYYTSSTYPKDVATKTEEAIASDLVAAARRGLGAFGEFGMLNDEASLSAVERKVFRAVAKAQQRTGLPIFTHTNYATGPHVSMEAGLRQLDALEGAGARLANVAIGHVCCLDDPMVRIAKAIAKRGAFVAFDRLTRQQQWVPDAKKVAMIRTLLDAGLVNRLLLSSDYIGRIINTSVGEVKAYPGPLNARDGGPGYARSLLLFVPQLRKAGVSEQTIHQLTVENPKRFLSFTPVA